MAGGTPLTGFSQFIAITPPWTTSGPEEVVNDAQSTNYRTLGYMLRGQPMSRILQQGSSLQDRIFLAAVRRSRTYLPQEQQQSVITQTHKMYTAGWRFFLTDMSWADEPMILNAGPSMESSARSNSYKNYWFELRQQFFTDWFNYMEEVLWATPNKLTMEALGGQEPYPIGAFINQMTNGLFVPGSAGVGGTWTTVEQIDPTATDSTNWKPYRAAYDDVDPDSTVSMLAAMGKAIHKTDFQPPPMDKKYFENPMGLPRPGAFLACSLSGISHLELMYRKAQDRWINQADPFNKPLYAGAPAVYVSQLDTATLYPLTTTSTTTEASATVVGPRIYGIQPEYMCYVYHKDRFMEPLGPFTEKETPTEHTMYLNTYGNLICRSRARHFIVYPTTSVANIA